LKDAGDLVDPREHAAGEFRALVNPCCRIILGDFEIPDPSSLILDPFPIPDL